MVLLVWQCYLFNLNTKCQCIEGYSLNPIQFRPFIDWFMMASVRPGLVPVINLHRPKLWTVLYSNHHSNGRPPSFAKEISQAPESVKDIRIRIVIRDQTDWIPIMGAATVVHSNMGICSAVTPWTSENRLRCVLWDSGRRENGRWAVQDQKRCQYEVRVFRQNEFDDESLLPRR